MEKEGLNVYSLSGFIHRERMLLDTCCFARLWTIFTFLPPSMQVVALTLSLLPGI